MHPRDAQQADGVERLLAAARRLFARRGFFGVSAEDLVQAAAVTRPVLYYHFGSKEGLYLAVARKMASEYATALAHAGSEGVTTVEKICNVCRAHVVARRQWALPGVAAAVVPSDEMARKGGTACARGIATVVETLVAEGIAKGEIAPCDPAVAALALIGAAEATLAHAPSGTSESSQEGRLNEVAGLVFRGLAPQEAS